MPREPTSLKDLVNILSHLFFVILGPKTYFSTKHFEKGVIIYIKSFHKKGKREQLILNYKNNLASSYYMC